MTYLISHTTKYTYSEAVPVCHNEVRLSPRETGWQRCRAHVLTIHPEPASRGRRMDYFGNTVDYFSIHVAHRNLAVTSSSRVELASAESPDIGATPAWEQVAEQLAGPGRIRLLDTLQYVYPSPSVLPNPQLREYALASFPPGRPIGEAARELTARLHRDFAYDTRATTIHTPLDDVFRLRRGVCQDFAHVQIGCLRSLGLAARYVSGYLRTLPPAGRPRLVGADASHAWISLYCGPAGWIDFDPTNDAIPTTDHITLAWGRDYGDVCPIKGVFVGGGQHAMTVSVDVEPLAD